MKWWNNYQIQLEFIKKYNNQDSVGVTQEYTEQWTRERRERNVSVGMVHRRILFLKWNRKREALS